VAANIGSFLNIKAYKCIIYRVCIIAVSNFKKVKPKLLIFVAQVIV